jgi:hypothetical protein
MNGFAANQWQVKLANLAPERPSFSFAHHYLQPFGTLLYINTTLARNCGKIQAILFWNQEI